MPHDDLKMQILQFFLRELQRKYNGSWLLIFEESFFGKSVDYEM